MGTNSSCETGSNFCTNSYHFHNRETNTGNQSINGLGGYYDYRIISKFIKRIKIESTLFIHSLQAGAGVKIPVGKFDEMNNGSVNPSYQVGTGSWDYLIAMEYVIRRKQLGLNALLNYVIKTENDKTISLVTNSIMQEPFLFV